MGIKAQRQKYKDWHKKEGLCRNCPNEVSINSNYCAACLYKKNIHGRLYYQDNREYILEKRKILFDKRVAEGKCNRCGSPLIDDEVRCCLACKVSKSHPVIKGGILNEVNN